MEPQNIRCPSCGILRFRTSQVRFSAIPYLALMRFPVRCHSCQERLHVGYRVALRILHTQRLHASLVMEAEDVGRQKARVEVPTNPKDDH
jgi:DNA-directed RNA polymerase subunit N (RpoN/RPB10)